MIRSAYIAVTIWLALGSLSGAFADRIPTPTFSDHPIPTTVVPSGDAAWWAMIDITALVVAIGLASYFAHLNRSRTKLLMLTVASLIWFGFVRGGCICAIGATQNVTLAIFNPNDSVPFVAVVFFTLPLVSTLFFGRTFCAAVCPLGAVQELVALRHLRVPFWLDQALGLLAFFYLGAAILLAGTGTAFVICRYDPFVAFFRLSGSLSMLVFGSCLLLIGIFVARPYCRYLCPYGALLRVVSRFTKWHVSATPSTCTQCGSCEQACPYDAIRPPSEIESAATRSQNRRRLWCIVGLSPILVIIAAWWGSHLGPWLASWDWQVHLAEQLRQEELALIDPTQTTDAFHLAGHSLDRIYRDATSIRERFAWFGTWLGAWIGLVVTFKLVQLSLHSRRIDFEPDRSGCFSCGRCFAYCPLEQERLGQTTELYELLSEVKR